ncbi:MAG: VOC family protein [Acidobacteriota bacterium]
MAEAIPRGYHTITPMLVVRDGAKAIDFYKRALGATERFRMSTPDGKVGHAELQIGDSMLMLSDEFPGAGHRSPQSIGGTPVSIFIYTEDVDALFKRAVDAGATADMPPADMFWGDRFGRFTDPFGHSWAVATHKEDVSEEEMRKRAEVEMAKMAQRTQKA